MSSTFGNFEFVRCTGQHRNKGWDGRPVESKSREGTRDDAVNLTMTGDVVTFGQDYEDYMDACVAAATDRVNKKGRKQRAPGPGEPRERWRDLVEAIARQVQAGDPDAQALVPALMKAGGAREVGQALVGRVPSR